MPRSITRTYSRHTRNAASLLGSLIRVARKEAKLTAQEVADRAGISRGLLQRIEKGDLKCELGLVFEVATLLGVTLFEVDDVSLTKELRHARDKLALMPKSIRKVSQEIKDDF